MNHKQKLGYTVLGAVIMLVGLAVGAIVSPPLIAQRNGVFDEIQCSKLTVINKAGKRAVVLDAGEERNGVNVFDKQEKPAVSLVADAKSNGMLIFDKANKPAVLINAGEAESQVYIVTNRALC